MCVGPEDQKSLKIMNRQEFYDSQTRIFKMQMGIRHMKIQSLLLRFLSNFWQLLTQVLRNTFQNKHYRYSLSLFQNMPKQNHCLNCLFTLQFFIAYIILYEQQLNERELKSAQDMRRKLHQKSYQASDILQTFFFLNQMTANNATAELKIFVDHHKKDICFNDPHSDLFVMFKGNIIPLHKEIASNSAYLNELAKPTKNMIFINEDLNLNALLKVLSCLYGHVLKYDRSIHTTQIFDVVMFLNVDKLKQAMLEDIQNYFEDYGIFTLYNIASKYSVGWLQKKCLNQLIYLKFQQILINKFDLFKISKETFFVIFKHHQTLKQKGIQLTLSETEVKKLVQQYNSVHSLSLSADDILSSTVQDEQSLDNIFDDFDIVGSRGTKVIKKRKSTWNCPNSTKLIQVDKLETTKKRRDTEDVKNGLEWSRQINDLKKKNRQILSRSNSMLQQIKATTAKAQCINFSNENRRQEKMQEKISEMVQVLKQQSNKLQKAQQTVRELLLKSK